MISALLQNLWAFALSMPTNMVILIIICLIMKCVFKAKWGDCIRVIVGYLLIGLLLAIFGITMPSFIVIGRAIADKAKEIFGSLW